MAATQKSESALLKKVWDIANVLSAAGVGFTRSRSSETPPTSLFRQ